MKSEPITHFVTYAGVDLRTTIKIAGGAPYVDLKISSAAGSRVVELNAADIGMICQMLDDARAAAMTALVRGSAQ